MREVPRFSFGTVTISALHPALAVETLFGLVQAGCSGHVACTCTHGVVEAEDDLQMRDIINGSLMTLPDGMPTVWIGRIKGCAVERVTATHFLEAVLADPRARNVRHFFYGGRQDTLEGIVARAKGMAGPQAIAGWYSPPLRAPGVMEERGIIEQIAATRPDIIWVGLGLPKQEYWMRNHAHLFPSCILVGVGAAFDWYAGTQPRAPRSLQNLGLEWLYRLTKEPFRLWPRYRRVVPKALCIMVMEIARSLRRARRR